jgi:hypothetical protein
MPVIVATNNAKQADKTITANGGTTIYPPFSIF